MKRVFLILAALIALVGGALAAFVLYLANVFERFYMVTRTPARHLGSGLGLAIVRELVDAMGGEVRAESGAGRGARMVVVLRSPGAAVAA